MIILSMLQNGSHRLDKLFLSDIEPGSMIMKHQHSRTFHISVRYKKIRLDSLLERAILRDNKLHITTLISGPVFNSQRAHLRAYTLADTRDIQHPSKAEDTRHNQNTQSNHS
jgi:hypothetical protein